MSSDGDVDIKPHKSEDTRERKLTKKGYSMQIKRTRLEQRSRGLEKNACRTDRSEH